MSEQVDLRKCPDCGEALTRIQHAVGVRWGSVLHHKQGGLECLKRQLAALQGPECGLCGGLMSRNPHPEAGEPKNLCHVGTVWVCIPCLAKANHGWAERATKAEKITQQQEEQNAQLREKNERLIQMSGAWQTADGAWVCGRARVWFKDEVHSYAAEELHDKYRALGYSTQELAKAAVAQPEGEQP